MVRAGYKQTEVGVIPEDWEVKSFSDISTNIGDGIHATPHYTLNGEYAFINGNNLSEGKIITNENTKNLTYQEKLKFKQILSDKTILLSINGTIGNLAFYQNEKILLGKSAAFINVQGIYSKQYIYYALQAPTTLKAFDDNLTGSTIKNLGLKTIKDTKIVVPKLKEQTAIATALSDIDALITTLTELIDKKRQIKTATMQQLLTGKQRLAGFGGIWEWKTFDSIAENFSSGATPHRAKKSYYKGTIKWVTSGELNYNIITDTIEHISEEALKKANLTIHEPNTFLMAITGLEAAGTRGSCAILGVRATTNQSCMALTIKPNFSIQYLYYYYCYMGETLAFEYCQGTKQQSYTAKIVKKLPIYIPPTLKEQQAIAQVLSDMDDDLNALETRLTKTKAIKQGMMQELLTGRTRLV